MSSLKSHAKSERAVQKYGRKHGIIISNLEEKAVALTPANRIGPQLKLSLQHAVSGLLNCSTKVITESKTGPHETKITFPVEVLSLMKGMFSSGKPYPFDLHFSTTLVSSGAGVLSGFIAWSPSVTSFLEWTALAALFDEVKLHKSMIVWTTALASSGGVTAGVVQFALGPDNVNNGSTPSGFNAVQRLSQSVEFSSHAPGKGGEATLRKSHKAPNRPYCSTASPATVTPPSGCCGQWSFGTATAGSNTITYAYLAMSNVVKLRSRA